MSKGFVGLRHFTCFDRFPLSVRLHFGASVGERSRAGAVQIQLQMILRNSLYGRKHVHSS